MSAGALTTPEQQHKAASFLAMHSAETPLLLPNAWDAASARIVEQSGFPAIATTSAGIAFTLGYPDGQKISRPEMLAVVARIARAVNVPVTADVEAGYGKRPEDAAETARAAIAAGAVGMNFEDATGDPSRPLTDLPLQLERVRAIRETAEALKLHLVLNARTDVYLAQVGDPTKRYDEALRRLRAYREGGADCVFVPGLRDAPTIGRIAADLGCPVNILGGPGAPPVAELAAMGVKRISLGSGPMRAAIGILRQIAREIKATGTYRALEHAPSHAEMNELMAAANEN